MNFPSQGENRTIETKCSVGSGYDPGTPEDSG